MTPYTFPQLPPPNEGYEYAVRVHANQTYMTTGLFPIGAQDHRLLHLYRVTCLEFDVDLKDWFIHARGMTKAEAEAHTLALSREQVESHLTTDLAPVAARAWAKVFPGIPGAPDHLPGPTAFVWSGCGFHLYLWIRDGEGYGDDIPLARALNRELARRLNRAAGYDMISLSTTDTGTRILRVVGTSHTKNPSRPLKVSLQSLHPEINISIRAFAAAWGVTVDAPTSSKENGSSPTNPVLIDILTSSGLLVPSGDIGDILLASRLPALRSMVAEDPLFQWAVRCPGRVGREPWRAMATNLIRLSNDRHDEARVVFHEVSALDGERYKPEECDAYFDDGIKSATSHGPITYDQLIQTEGDNFLDEVFPPGTQRPASGSAPAGEAARRMNARAAAAAVGLPVWGSGSGGSGLPPNPAENRPFGPYQRGSEVELGKDLADRLGRDRTVFTLGEWRQYDPISGGWKYLHPEIVERMAHVYDGKSVETMGKDGVPAYKVIKLSNNGVLGIAADARRELFQVDFFDQATPGILFKNGFLTLDGVLHPFSLEYRAFTENALPFDYDPIGKPTALMEYNESAFRGDPDAAEKILLFQEFLGACLFGIATEYQKALILVGEGEAGKSTILFVLEDLFPRGSVTSVAPQDFGREYNKVRLAVSRINIVSEMPENEIIESTSVKAIITGDYIEGRQIREKVVRFKPKAGHIFATNNLPPSNDRTDAFFRRFTFISYNNRFVVKAEQVNIPARRYPRDSTLKGRMLSELPQIAAWFVAGALRLKAQGSYTEPISHVAKLDEWRTMSDTVLVFSRDCLQKTPGQVTTSKTLYGAYDAWCKANGHKALSSTKFSPRLEALGFEKRKITAAAVWDVYLCDPGTAGSVTPSPHPGVIKTHEELMGELKVGVGKKDPDEVN